MARATLSAPAEFQRSMPLLRKIFRDLADLHSVPLPNAILDCRDAISAVVGEGVPPAEAAALRRWIALFPQRLRRAHKFSLDADFTRLVETAMAQPPAALARLLATARMPFDEVWIEWPTLDSEYGELGSEGYLISAQDGFWRAEPVLCWHAADGPMEAMREANPGAMRHLADISGPLSPGFVSLPCYRLDFSVDDAAVISTDDNINDIELTLGREYTAAHRRRRADLERLAEPAAITTTPLGAYGEALLRLARQDRDEGDDEEWELELSSQTVARLETAAAESGRSIGEEAAYRINQPAVAAARDRLVKYLAVTLLMSKTSQIWRRLIATLALMSTHIGGSPLVAESAAQRVGAWLARGRPRPSFEYRVLTLYRPVEPAKLFRRAFPAKQKSDGIPLHEVAGAWHHRRAPAANCREYPGSCALADWSPVVDDDQQPVGAEQQRCGICARKRWFIAGHPRGDRQFGVIEKSYRVRASGRTRDAGGNRREKTV